MHTPSLPASTAASSLRERASTRLHNGAKPAQTSDASSALRVLFDLASSPATAHDALALLHELQVHQVELDLQNEELLASRAELEAAWQHQLQLNDALPCAHVTLDAAACVLACNAAALACFQQSLVQVQGKAFSNWLPMADTPRIQAWLSHAQSTGKTLPLHLHFAVQGRAELAVCAAARSNPMAPGYLITWVNAAPC